MTVLAFVWLALPIVEFIRGFGTWEARLGTAIWIVFIIHFAIFGCITATIASLSIGQQGKAGAGQGVSRSELAALREELASLRAQVQALTGSTPPGQTPGIPHHPEPPGS